MLFQKGSGFMGLPSWYGAGYRYLQRGSVEMEASGLPSKDVESAQRSCHFSQSLSAAELKRNNKNRILSPSVPFPSKLVVNGTPTCLKLNGSRNPMRGLNRMFLYSRHPQRANSMSPQFGDRSKDSGIDLPNGTGDHEQNLSSSVRRRRSLSPLPNCNTRENGPTQPLARKIWSGSEPDLRASSPKESHRGPELGGATLRPGGQSQRLREQNLEVELNMMQFELFSLKQKMVNSFAHLEKEKKWLETNFLENRKQEGDLDDKIFSVEMELAKAKSSLGRRDHKASAALDSSQNGAVGMRDIGQDLVALQESLAAHKKRIKALERKGSEMEWQLKSAKEGQQMAFSQLSEAKQRATDSLQASQALREERDRLQAAYNSLCLEKDQLEEKVNELNLELKPALSDRKRLLEEKVALHQQVQRLTLELEYAQKQREGFRDQVSALHSELASAKSRVNHQDKEKVLMKEELESTRQAKEELMSEVAESHRRLEDSLEKLHHLEAEKKILDNRVRALEDERSRLLGEREEIPLQNKADGRKQEEGAMKAFHESCENLRESQTLPRRENDLLQARCLEPEPALHGKQEEMGNQLAEQREISQSWRDRWEEEAAALQTKEKKLEVPHPQAQALPAKAEAPLLLQIQLDACKQELELERNRSQALHHQVQQLQFGGPSQAVPAPEIWNHSGNKYIDFSSEKQRLEQLVTSLEEQLAEKEQALRELKDAKDADKTPVEIKAPSSEPKGGHRGLDAKVIRSPQQEQERLKLQHQLVTEQLKGIFKQRAQQKQGSRKHPGRLEEESSALSPKSQGTLVAAKSVQFPEGSEPKLLDVHCSSGEVESLRQQLKEKAETISSMASEIHALKEKNESLMKAKLRFQQQIQEIRRLSKQQPEKRTTDLLVPRLSGSLPLHSQGAHGGDSSLPSPQSDEPTSASHSRENLPLVGQHPSPASAGEEQGHLDTGAGHLSPVGPVVHDSPIPTAPLQLLPDLPDPAMPPIRLSLGAATPSLQKAQGPAESEGASLSPRSPALLSPRPFGHSGPPSPFKFQGSPEASDN